MSRFTGVWATFEYLDEFSNAIRAVKNKGVVPTVLSPCPRHEIDNAMGNPETRLPYISLVFGALGCLIGFSFPAWTASDWVLPVSEKAIVAIPPFAVIGFELTILFAALFTLLGVIGLATWDALKNPLPKALKRYVRFQRDRFGIVIPCDLRHTKDYENLLISHGAEEVYIENE
ncbi:DUF3341 domain-containing protein [Deltaproteobacteria bacterium TL4]